MRDQILERSVFLMKASVDPGALITQHDFAGAQTAAGEQRHSRKRLDTFFSERYRATKTLCNIPLLYHYANSQTSRR